MAGGLATAAGFFSMDKAVPEGIHEATPDARTESVESETTHNKEPQQELEVDVTTVPETEKSHPEIDSSLPNDPAPVPLALEPESSLIETELVAESQVETTSTATTRSVPIDVEDQPEPSLSETSPKDIEEIRTQVDDDTSNIKDEPIPESNVAQHIEAADTELEAPSNEVPTKESHVIQLEPEVDFVAPAEEEPSAIAQLASENLSPEIESESAISQTSVETLPIPEDSTASQANVEDQIIAPVDARSEHAAVVVETLSTDEPAEVILPPNLEESPETLKPPVEPSYKVSEDETARVSVFSF